MFQGMGIAMATRFLGINPVHLVFCRLESTNPATELIIPIIAPTKFNSGSLPPPFENPFLMNSIGNISCRGRSSSSFDFLRFCDFRRFLANEKWSQYCRELLPSHIDWPKVLPLGFLIFNTRHLRPNGQTHK